MSKKRKHLGQQTQEEYDERCRVFMAMIGQPYEGRPPFFDLSILNIHLRYAILNRLHRVQGDASTEDEILNRGWYALMIVLGSLHTRYVRGHTVGESETAEKRLEHIETTGGFPHISAEEYSSLEAAAYLVSVCGFYVS